MAMNLREKLFEKVRNNKIYFQNIQIQKTNFFENVFFEQIKRIKREKPLTRINDKRLSIVKAKLQI